MDTNIKAHNFIPAEYWKSNFRSVKEALLLAEVYVYEYDTEIQGFIGLSNEYIEGIFVSAEMQSQGIGKILLNYVKGKRNKLILTVFAKDVQELPENEEQEVEVEGEDGEIAKKEEMTNEVVLIGFVCKKPIYRQTPFGREIADLLLAVNRAYNKSDYIPTIAWGRNARFCENIEVGTEVKVAGRVQSRTYEKKYEDGTSETKVAYEVSISSLEVVKQDGDEDQNDMVNEEEQKEAM